MASARRLTDYDLARPDAAGEASDGGPGGATAGATGSRLKLWEIGNGFHCSIIGTCLATSDLTALARRLRLTVPASATDYETHGHFVQHSIQEGTVARAVQRLLDHRYAGALRQVGRLSDAAALAASWEEFKASGRIAGGYWALLSYRHVPADLTSRAFGEVHMMSHLQGAAVRHHATRVDQLERDNAELRDRLVRATRSAREMQAAVADRDRRMAALTERLAAAEAAPGRTDSVRSPGPPRSLEDRLERKLAKRERSLAAARTRARDLEAEVGRLNRDLAARHPPTPAAAPAPTSPPLAADAPATLPPRIPGGACRLLYVGGRPGLLPHLRDVAERRQASLLHHDGGKEETLQRIDDLVEGVDAVLCPVDCVSHSACLRVKHLCQRHDKPFLPLKSASRSCFARALIELGLTPPPSPDASGRAAAGRQG